MPNVIPNTIDSSPCPTVPPKPEWGSPQIRAKQYKGVPCNTDLVLGTFRVVLYPKCPDCTNEQKPIDFGHCAITEFNLKQGTEIKEYKTNCGTTPLAARPYGEFTVKMLLSTYENLDFSALGFRPAFTFVENGIQYTTHENTLRIGKPLDSYQVYLARPDANVGDWHKAIYIATAFYAGFDDLTSAVDDFPTITLRFKFYDYVAMLRRN